MGITLFEHNQRAYEAVRAMLSETGKAAVIHPTGTGKSFIGFKLCEEFQEKRICWLSPSNYIFETQLENVKAASDGYQPDNIVFHTYAKLMLMNEAELKAIKPDYIIFDEFHRCGAEMWGEGVKRLLALYPDIPLLGLSATAIRYLDNQRNMADELFGGNVASEMSLGEAIVQGILDPPTYVMSVYSYQKDLERYEARIRRAKNKAVQDAAEQYLEELRRTLEKADGLDEIFHKHMTARHGKYIAFCASAEHMEQMMEQVPAWFGKLDSEPHVYSLYSEDPTASRSFREFKADNSDHLRLLFCIDALNEGIHVEHIDGVILFRPTVSPIVYKQQIGRALSASKTREPIIFDIVNNIENLYSIDSVQEEMSVAMSYYRFMGEGGKIVNERFRVIDEVRGCRELFELLNDTLTASWELMYELASEYAEAHGDLLVPRRYKTEQGYSLGNWIAAQRKVRSGEQFGVLGEERIAKLDRIGMVWEDKGSRSWNRFYAAAKTYYEANGDLNVPKQYVTESGVKLGVWIGNLRTYRKTGIQKNYLTVERIEALDALGMIWDVPDYIWQRNYAAAMEYHREHGDLDVPSGYVTDDGVRLGAWISNMRQSRRGTDCLYRVTAEQIRLLDELGMVWDDAYTRRWEYGYSQAVLYHKQHGNLNVPSAYINENGFALGKWLKKHTEVNKTTGRTALKLTAERQEKLDRLGMNWEKTDPWEQRYAYAKAFYEKYGHLRVPAQYKVNGVNLNKWVNEQRQTYIGNRGEKRLTTEQIRRMEAIGMVWGSTRQKSQAERYAPGQV